MEILRDLEKVRFNLEVSINEIENILKTAKDFKKASLSNIKKIEKARSILEFETKAFKDCLVASENVMKIISKFSKDLDFYTWYIKYNKEDKVTLKSEKEE